MTVFLDTDILPERIRDSPPGRARRGNSVRSEPIRRTRSSPPCTPASGRRSGSGTRYPGKRAIQFPHYRGAAGEWARSSKTGGDRRLPDYHSGSR